MGAILIVPHVMSQAAPAASPDTFSKEQLLKECYRQAALTSRSKEITELIKAHEAKMKPWESAEVLMGSPASLKVEALRRVIVLAVDSLKLEPVKKGDSEAIDHLVYQVGKETFAISKEILLTWDPAYSQFVSKRKEEFREEEKRRGKKLGEFWPTLPSPDPALDSGIGQAPTSFDREMILSHLTIFAFLEIIEEDGKDVEKRKIALFKATLFKSDPLVRPAPIKT